MSSKVSSSTLAVGLAFGFSVRLGLAQGLLFTDRPIAEIGDYPLVARQSSDFREDTVADVALPVIFETLAIPNATSPAYTQAERNPWWQIDLRGRRNMTTVAARFCEGFVDNGANGPLPNPSSTEDFPQIACNTDYDLAGAWMLVSDLPFPSDPWAAPVPDDPNALLSRFPIVGNGYQQPQVATLNRSGRYLRIQFPPGTTRALALEKLDVRGEEGITDPVIALHRVRRRLPRDTGALRPSIGLS